MNQFSFLLKTRTTAGDPWPGKIKGGMDARNLLCRLQTATLIPRFPTNFNMPAFSPRETNNHCQLTTKNRHSFGCYVHVLRSSNIKHHVTQEDLLQNILRSKNLINDYLQTPKLFSEPLYQNQTHHDLASSLCSTWNEVKQNPQEKPT